MGGFREVAVRKGKTTTIRGVTRGYCGDRPAPAFLAQNAREHLSQRRRGQPGRQHQRDLRAPKPLASPRRPTLPPPADYAARQSAGGPEPQGGRVRPCGQRCERTEGREEDTRRSVARGEFTLSVLCARRPFLNLLRFQPSPQTLKRPGGGIVTLTPHRGGLVRPPPKPQAALNNRMTPHS
ncbi:hypothetical protein AAFF_G00055710 [Aldrovandia affinis]|uniref:Uncharacterized protein n=1 Tax=Aldrovandia affinis TaxID=143900 RepID=A0AAD7S0R3_9TELE|nr:hypothetical protein AAFF_G00055710 [Aldrovandia affinis]